MSKVLDFGGSAGLLVWYFCSWTLVAGYLGIPAPAEAEDLQVNVTNEWSDRSAAIAMNAAGEAVIVWLSERADGDPIGSIQGRRYGVDGGQRGDQLRINTDTTENEQNPTVAINGAAEFVVAWTRVLGFDGEVVECQRFNAEGVKVGEQMAVNFYEVGWASHPSLAMDDEGSFVIVWSEAPDLDQWVILGRRFDAKTGKLGLPFPISAVVGAQNNGTPDVAMTADGERFVVAWRNRVLNDPNTYEILARRFAGDLSPLGVLFRANSVQSGEQRNPAVAIDAEGNFVIAWGSESSAGSDASGSSIQVRRFGKDGSAAGPEVQANSYTLNDQQAPDVAMSPAGDFAVAWHSYGSPTQGDEVSSLQLQRFLADGSFAGGPSEVNTTFGVGLQPAEVGIDAEGAVVAAWSITGGLGNDPSHPIVRSRAIEWNQLFGDGFESGTVDNWSTSQP